MHRHHQRVVRHTGVEKLESRLLFATLTVTHLGDAGAGSLRDAIAAAVDGDVIQFQSGLTGTIALAGGQLAIDDDLTLTGPGAGLLSLSGGGSSRIFDIASGANVVIENLAVTSGGGVEFGGGIQNAGNLALNFVDVTGNTASSYGGGIFNNASLAMTGCTVAGNAVMADLMYGQSVGGGLASVSSGGAVSITACTFADNTAGFAPGGSFFMHLQARGGGLSFEGNSPVAITNSTVSGNTANSYSGDEDGGGGPQMAYGGGILFWGSGNLTLLNSTLADNGAGSFSGPGDTPDNASGAYSQGGGLFTDGSATAVIVTNTLIAGNIAIEAPDVFNYGPNSTFRNNLIADGSGSSAITDNIDGNLIGSAEFPIDPLLAPLASNGGATQTRALLAGSPAIDAGLANAAPAADQRGVARTALPDIGAYEGGALNTAPTFTSTPPTSATAGVTYTYHVTAQDQDGNDLIISAGQLPAWLTLTGTGNGTAILSGTPTNAFAGANAISLTVADGTDSTQQNFSIAVTAVNHPPALPARPIATAVAGTAFSRVLYAEDVDGDLLSFAVVSKPDWLIVTDNADNTATLSGTPSAVDGGLNQLVLQVSDGEFAAQQVFDIDVIVPRWTFDNGLLGINGDAADNTILVFPVGSDTLRVVRDGVIKNFPLAGVLAVEIYGYDGNDTISVNTRTLPTYVLGGAHDDTLIGGDEVDNFVGGGGKDFIDAGGGNDRLDGGNGNDVLWGGAGDDRLLGGGGNDRLVGGDGSDTLNGEDGDDWLYTRDGFIDYLTGGAGTNYAESDFMVDYHLDEFAPLILVTMPVVV